MTKTRRKTKNEVLQDNDPAGVMIKSLIAFIAFFMPRTCAARLIATVFIIIDMPIQRICVLTGLCERTVSQLKRDNGVVPFHTLLTIKKGSGRKGDLIDIKDEIKKELETNNYYSRQQIADMIWDKFHIRIRLSAIGEHLKKWGYKRLKCGSIPAKADPEKQATFYEETLKPLLDLAQAGKIVLLSMDAAHFVFGCNFLGYVYSLMRRFIETFSGRQRYNVLGALNLITKKVHTFTNEKYINAEAVCELLKKIAAEYPGQIIHIILDNARYQKCKLVTELAKQLGIILNPLPTYSPNLNHIERLWKFVKSILRTKRYSSFAEFKETIDTIIESTVKENKAKIDTLIGQKVQLFNFKKVDDNTYQLTA